MKRKIIPQEGDSIEIVQLDDGAYAVQLHTPRLSKDWEAWFYYTMKNPHNHVRAWIDQHFVRTHIYYHAMRRVVFDSYDEALDMITTWLPHIHRTDILMIHVPTIKPHHVAQALAEAKDA